MARRIFIVEDHAWLRQMLGEYVRNLAGFEVCGAVATAEEALAALEITPADLVVVDVSLPRMDGVELASAIQAQWPALPCLMLSGHGETTHVERALAAGARGYVWKGDPSELGVALQRVLEGETYISEAMRDLLDGGLDKGIGPATSSTT